MAEPVASGSRASSGAPLARYNDGSVRAASVKIPLLALLVWLLAAMLYGTRLGYSPIYMMHDELKFVLQAHAIASTGCSLTGDCLPVYFTEPEFPAGRDPAAIYATALALRVLPLSEASARLPSALIGALDVVLVFVLAQRLLARTWLALLAAVLMACTPAHFLRSRLALSPHYAIPFILAWLLCLEAMFRHLSPGSAPIRPRRGEQARWAAVGAGTSLGLGMYAYLAAIVMMPLYLLTSLAGLRWAAAAGELGLQRCRRGLVAGFLVCLVPMGAWHMAHPERIAQIAAAYRVFSDPGRTPAASTLGPSPSSAILPAASAASSAAQQFTAFLARRLDVYWSAFNPDFLFLEGAVGLIDSTRRAGVFPAAFGILMPVGLWHCLRRGGDLPGRVVAVGLLTAPLATALSGHLEMNRVLFLLPFGVLAAGFGAARLLTARQTSVRWTGVALVAAVPLQFAGFYGDYMGAYRLRSSAAFGGNLRSALEVVLRDRQIPAEADIVVSGRIPYAERYWRFYALKEGRGDLLDRVRYVDESIGLEATAAGSYLVCQAQAPACAGVDPAAWAAQTRAVEPDGQESFLVYRKVSR